MKGYCDSKGTAAEDHHEDLNIAIKGGRPEDFCTRVDLENERLITEGIRAQFPTHQILGEESVGTGPIPRLLTPGAPPTWIIDPIDGTTNFAAGLPLTCVSIGLCCQCGGEGGGDDDDDVPKPVLGVVYAPVTDELYLTVAGHGAYRNGVLITQRRNNNHKKTLLESVVCFEFGYARDPDAVRKMVGAVERILLKGCRTTRCLGSGVLDLLYVATGRIDVVYAGVAGEGWKPWDYCAGLVFVKEAGAVVEAIDPPPLPAAKTGEATTTTTNEFDLYSDSIICAVGQSLLEEVRQVIKAV